MKEKKEQPVVTKVYKVAWGKNGPRVKSIPAIVWRGKYYILVPNQADLAKSPVEAADMEIGDLLHQLEAQREDIMQTEAFLRGAQLLSFRERQ